MRRIGLRPNFIYDGPHTFKKRNGSHGASLPSKYTRHLNQDPPKNFLKNFLNLEKLPTIPKPGSMHACRPLRKSDARLKRTSETPHPPGFRRNWSRILCLRTTDASPRLRAICMRARESLIDIAESNLRTSLLSSSPEAATFFTLKTLGRDRGYVERKEQDVSTHASHDATPTIDLSKLTTQQLKSLSNIVDKAQPAPTIIDITPESK